MKIAKSRRKTILSWDVPVLYNKARHHEANKTNCVISNYEYNAVSYLQHKHESDSLVK